MMKVAVLDDSPTDVRIILGMLDDLSSRIVRPFSVQAFTDPFALLDAVQEKGGFDLYFLDIIMPVMSGMEVARVSAVGARRARSSSSRRRANTA